MKKPIGLVIKKKIGRLYNTLIRDEWGNLTDCYWNTMVKEDIVKLEKKLI